MTDEETTPPCGCCVRTDGHEPWCVCVQPDEYVIDDHTPGVLRPATPADYGPAAGMRVVTDPTIPPGKAYIAPLGQSVMFGESDGFTRAILGAQEDVNALAADLDDLRRGVCRLAHELIQPTLTSGQREVMNERVSAELLALIGEDPLD